MRLNRAGFSLIELLLVTSLIPIISLVVFGNLNSGYKIWKAINTESPIEDLSVFYEKSKRDFLNTTRFSGYPFKAEDGRISFVTLIVADTALGGDKGLGEVSYFYDTSKRMIMREQRSVHDLYKESGGQRTSVLSGVSAFKASFLVYEKLSESYIWNEAWDGTEVTRFPVAVRFQFELTGPSGAYQVTKSFKIPIGGYDVKV